MGPALKQLFETVKQNQISDDADVLVGIFERHGEALIAALDLSQRLLEQYAAQCEDPMAANHALHIEQLLAQLDSEAQR